MANAPKIAFHTLGCKLNQAETEKLLWQAIDAGYVISSVEDADICVLNTCTVTHIADRKARHLVRLWRKKNPGATIVAAGCYAERAARDLRTAGADIVLGNEKKQHLLDIIAEACHAGCAPQPVSDGDGQLNRVRSFIKIQDGCDTHCTYCIVPQVRGRERCLPADDIIKEIKARVNSGYKEIVLTGTKIGSYKTNGTDLRQLVKHILSETEVERLHLSSLQPQDISPQLLELWQDSRLCHHFHLALQSGSDSMLARMGRSYSITDYVAAVGLIRGALPDASITTDIMVGFPGETDTEFLESYRFCKEIGFAAIHVFPYSPRPGTLAALMSHQVSEKVKKARSQQMLALSAASAERFRRRFLGQKMMVLWEGEVSVGSQIYSGLTHNYIRVFTHSTGPLTGLILPAKILRLHEDGVWADVVPEPDKSYPAVPSPFSRC